MKARTARNYWLWVTRPEYYLNEDGSDRDALEPSDVAEPGGWWTCDRATRQGDLVLLYRTSPRKDIAYLIEAGSDAYALGADDVVDERWAFGCDFRVVTKFTHPLTLSEMRSEAALSNWGAFRRNFQGIVFPIEPRIWDCLAGLLRRKNRITDDTLTLGPEPDVRVDSPTAMGAGFGDTETNREVEQSAVAFVTDWYRCRGWDVTSVETARCGFDLLCQLGKREEHVEVKGVSGQEPSFLMTGGEVDRARTDAAFVLCVVLAATSSSPRMLRVAGNEFSSSFDLTPVSFRAVARASSGVIAQRACD